MKKSVKKDEYVAYREFYELVKRVERLEKIVDKI